MVSFATKPWGVTVVPTILALGAAFALGWTLGAVVAIAYASYKVLHDWRTVLG